MTIHPDRPPNQPYHRGVSDLTGEMGDLLFGPYGRSENHYTANGSSTRKRDGYVRAYDEAFEGSAAALHHRDGATNYHIVADGEGLKVLSSIPPSAYSGVDNFHSGFANDSFDRANSNTVNTTGKNWIEGQDSEELAGRTAADDFEIDTNDLQLDSAVGTTAALDWGSRAPTLFHGYRIEMDFTNLALASVDDTFEFRFFLGLPGLYLQDDGLTVGRERQYAIDANATWSNTYPGGLGQDTCWQGLACRVRVKRNANSMYGLLTELAPFLANKQESSNDIRQGRLKEANNQTSSVNLAFIQTNYVLEFGRRQISNQEWKDEARLWKDTTIADIEDGTATDSNGGGTDPTHRIVVNETRNKNHSGFYYNLSKDGSGGYFGLVGTYNKSSVGTVEIPKLRATTSLV